MAHSFTAQFNGDLTALLQKVKDKVTSGGGSFTGDTTGGSFSGNTPLGKVVLNYKVSAGNTLQFTVAEKPFLAPNSTIESTVRSYLV